MTNEPEILNSIERVHATTLLIMRSVASIATTVIFIAIVVVAHVWHHW